MSGVHHGMHKVHLHLSQAQGKKLIKGHAIQLKHHHLMTGKHHVMLHHENAKKVHRAHRLGKGVRIQLSPYEIEASGEGLRDFFKKVGEFYNNKLKPYVGPVLKQTVRALKDTAKGAAKKIAPFLEHEIDSIDERYGEPGIEKLGKVTGAYGLRKKRAKGIRGGILLPIDHPALQDPIILNAPGWPSYKMMFHEMTPADLSKESADRGKRKPKRGGAMKGRDTYRGGSFRPSGL